MEWTECKNSLPERGCICIVYINDPNGPHISNGGWSPEYGWVWCQEVAKYVTHWMPAPAPPPAAVWVRSKDRLPDKDGLYLVYVNEGPPGKFMMVNYWETASRCWAWGGWPEEVLTTHTHWTPLPTPPPGLPEPKPLAGEEIDAYRPKDYLPEILRNRPDLIPKARETLKRELRERIAAARGAQENISAGA